MSQIALLKCSSSVLHQLVRPAWCTVDTSSTVAVWRTSMRTGWILLPFVTSLPRQVAPQDGCFLFRLCHFLEEIKGMFWQILELLKDVLFHLFAVLLSLHEHWLQRAVHLLAWSGHTGETGQCCRLVSTLAFLSFLFMNLLILKLIIEE